MNRIFSLLMDVLFPPRCEVCRSFLPAGLAGAERYFCRPCQDAFPLIRSPRCPVCSSPFAAGPEEDHWCEDCLRKRPLFDAVSALYHYEGAVMQVIHRFKYGGGSFLALPLGRILTRFVKGHFAESSNLLVMPVPLHEKRLRERGYNQSLMMARVVAGGIHAELDYHALKRVRYTAPQAGLTRDQRRKNVRGAFQVGKNADINGRTILLVDDVTTTGNTLNECARALKRGGCTGVFGLVLAKAGHRS